jgi:hypothetical protein
MKEMEARVWINEIEFSNGKKVAFGKNDIVVFVGPNNAGKSQALREILSGAANGSTQGKVVKAVKIIKEGDNEYKLKDEEAFFILAFTGSYSSWINLPLRNGYPLETECKKYFADCLDNALDKVPCFNDRYVFRMDTPIGSKQNLLDWFKNNIGNIVTTPYFLSTSKVNYENAEITWYIKTLKTESKARDLELLTNNAIEKEVLFKRDAFFKILKVDHAEGVVKMEEVEKPENSVKLTGFYFEG